MAAVSKQPSTEVKDVRTIKTNDDGYTETNKKYGDYKYQDYANKKDYKIYTKDNKSYYYDEKRKKYVDMDEQSMTTKKLDNKEYKSAVKQGYKGERTYDSKNNQIEPSKVADKVALESSDLTKEEKEKYKKSLIKQEKQQGKELNYVRKSGIGIDAVTGAINNQIVNPNSVIQENVVQPLSNAGRIYESGKMNNELALEWYKKMQGKPNKAEEIQSKVDTFNRFNQDVASGDVGFVGNTIQNLNTQVESLKNQGIAATLGGLGGAAIGGVAGVKSGNPIGGASKGFKLGSKLGYTVGSTPYMYQLEAGNQYKDLIEMGISDKKAKKVAKAVGTINAAIESGENIVDLLSFEGAGKIASNEIKNKAAKKMGEEFTDIINELGEDNAKSYLTRLYGGEIADNVLSTYGKNIVSESVEETAQEAVGIGGERYATNSEGIERDGSQDLQRLGKAFVAGGGSALVLGAPTSIAGNTASYAIAKVQSLNNAERNALITATQKRKAGQPLDQNDIAAINVINNKPIDVNAQAQNEVQQIQQAVQNGEMSLEDANNVLQSINNEMQQNQEIYSEPMTEQEGNEYYDDYAKTLDNVEEPQATEENKKQEEPKKKRFENLDEKDEKELDEIFNLQREGKELNSKQKEKLKYFERKEKGLKNPEINSEIERFNDVRSDYGIYKRFNPEKFDYTMLDKAKETIQGNRYGRTKQEWLDVAKNIGMQAENLDSKALKKYAFESFAAANPYTDMNKQGNKRTKLELHEWVKSVYDGAKVGTKQETSQPSINNQVEQNIETQQNNINATQKLENRVSGDKLLDAQDFINEVKDVGANVDDNGYVTVYHQTTPENAKKILDSGRMSSKEQAVFFSTSQNASQSDGRGSTKLEFKIPAEELELDDIFSDNADVKINLNGKKDIDVSKYLVRNNNIPVEMEKENLLKVTPETLEPKTQEINNYLKENVPLRQGEAYSRTPQTAVNSMRLYENSPEISDFKRETLTHIVATDKAAKIDASEKYKENGSLEENAAYIRGLLQSDKRLTKNDKALAIYTMKEALEQGNKEIADGIISDLTVLDVEAGQWAQASKLIKQMTPAGQLQTFIKMVNNSVQKGNPRFKNVKITDEMVNKVLDCYDENNKWDEAKFAKNMEEFKENIQSQMTPTLMDKFNSIRMLGMLGAPRTHIRNVIGNMGNVGLRMSKNINARVMESILIKDQSQRTRTFKPATKEIKDYVSNIAKEEVLGGNKYNDTKTELENNLKTFNENHKGMAKIVNPISKAMNKLSDGNSWLLDREDKLFSSFAYKRSLQEFLTARGMETVEDVNSNPKILAEGKEFAMQQALEATYRQDSELAAAISNYVKKSEKPNAKKTDKFLGTIVEANIPFKKTPINIAKTGVEFSPIGLTNGISDILVNVRNGKVEMSQAIDEISKGITGLGLLGIGVLLAHNGFELTAADDDKEKKAKYDKSLGEMEYSIKVGDRYYDLSWMAPSSMPLYTGIELYQALVKEQKLDGNAVVNTLAKTIDPLSSMSLLEGLSKSVKSYSKTPGEFISKFTLSSLENYVTQYVPTLLSQIANMRDDKKRTTTPSGDSSFTEFDKTWNSIKIKVPGLRQTLPEQTDAWGRTQMNESPGLRFFNSFFNPANNSKDKKDATDREIERLYNELGEDSYWSTRSLPKMDFDKFVTISKEKHNLSNEELVKYKKTYGKIAKDGADKLIKTKEYKNATDEEKGQMLSSLYDYANQKAKEEYGKSHNLNYDGYKLDQLYSIVDAYNIPIEKVVSNKSIQQLKADSNMAAKQKKIQAVDNIDGLTGLQKDALKRKFTMFMGNPGYKENEYALVDAVNNSNISQEEKDDIKRFLSLD